MLPPRPDIPTSLPGSEGLWVPARPDTTTPRPQAQSGSVRPRRGPRLLAGFVALTLALSAIGAGFIAVNGSLLPKGASGDHRFLMMRSDGEPMRWNPCEPVHYVVNPAGAPDGSVEDVHEAVRRISAATGVAFVFDGLTDEVLTGLRGSRVVQPYPDRWAPVLVAWVDPLRSDIRFEVRNRMVAGLAHVIPGPDSEVWVSGWIAMNRDDPNPPGWASPGDQGPILLHEFGHIMGLAHVKKPNELMHPAGGWMKDLGPGDREGLRQLGAEQGCLATPEFPS